MFYYPMSSSAKVSLLEHQLPHHGRPEEQELFYEVSMTEAQENMIMKEARKEKKGG